jgi:hypothetical protein
MHMLQIGLKKLVYKQRELQLDPSKNLCFIN